MKYEDNEIQTVRCKESHKPEKLYHEEQKDHRDGCSTDKEGLARHSDTMSLL
jgi:hypothetical protein